MKSVSLNPSSTLFLRLSLVAMALFVASLCVLLAPAFIYEENHEYRAIVTGLYVAALPFYFSLVQAWKLLGFIDRQKAFSESSLKALETIKNCALIISGLFILYLPLFWDRADAEDAPGLFAVGLFITFMSAVIAGFTALLGKLFQSAFKLKSENDLTV